MGIKIIPEPDIWVTQSELDHLKASYEHNFRVWSSTLPPPSFEQWIRTVKTGKKQP